MKYGLALGSNMGDRLAHLRRAKTLLLAHASASVEVACSAVYETDPVDCAPGAEPFYNACLEIDLPLTPPDLLALTQNIERDLGRETGLARNASRPIDIDILYAADGRTVSEPGLRIPHPRIAERRFVLEPLNEIRPGLVLPGRDESISETLNHLASTEPPLILVTRDW